jgi:hypothetical protein
LTSSVNYPTSPGWQPSRATFHFSESEAMSDIVERIRKLRFVHIPGTSDLMEEACQEIERLRNGAAAGCETVCPHVRGSVTQYCSLNFTLTDEEREAIAWGIACVRTDKHAATLRKLLARLHT